LAFFDPNRAADDRLWLAGQRSPFRRGQIQQRAAPRPPAPFGLAAEVLQKRHCLAQVFLKPGCSP
jgi:hypothetical protein